MTNSKAEMDMEKTQIIADPIDVVAALLDLGIDHQTFVHVFQRGQAARNSIGDNHPRIAKGFHGWSEMVCALRDRLCRKGWLKKDAWNLPLTISPDRENAIVVSAGDADTGRIDGIPYTNPKGVQAERYISKNLVLFGGPEYRDDDPLAYKTWILLYFHDQVRKEIRGELSVPINQDLKGRVDEWSTRIILPTVPLDDDRVQLDAAFSDEINIPVIEKRQR